MNKSLLMSSALITALSSLSAYAIVGGKDVQIPEQIAMHTVLLSINQNVTCSGTAIDNDLILTAAHCLADDAAFTPAQMPQVVIYFGVDANKIDRSKIRYADDYSFVPEYLLKTASVVKFGDVAMLHFQGGMPSGFSPVKTFPVEMIKDLQPGVTKVTAAGWGLIDPTNQTMATNLKQTNLVFQGIDYDPTTHTGTMNLVLGKPSSYLDDSTGLGHGVCEGDSGGPSYVTIDGTQYLLGVNIVISNPKCDSVSFASFSTVYQEWIAATAKTMRAETAPQKSPKI